RRRHTRCYRDWSSDVCSSDLEKPGPGEGPVAQVESRERKELLQAALDRLSPDMREAVVLRDLQDLDYEEIALVLGVPEGTVKSRDRKSTRLNSSHGSISYAVF